MTSSHCLVAACLLALTNCGTEKIPNSGTHIIPTDSYGLTYGPDQGQSKGDLYKAECHLRDRIDGLEHDFKKASGIEEILVFVHGGMNGQGTGINGAKDILKRLDDKKIFPVFITWDSGLIPSYVWHLRRDANGISDINNKDYYDDLRAVPRAPVLLTSDLAAGVGTAPKTFYNATGKTFQNWDWLYGAKPELMNTRNAYQGTMKHLLGKEWDGREQVYHQPGLGGVPFEFSLGAAKSTIDSNASGFVGAVGLPLSTVLSPIYDGVGKPAWQNMLRRARTLVHRYPTMLDLKQPPDKAGGGLPEHRKADGVVPEVLRQIARWQKKNPKLKVTFVGHSMGTIVLNEAFRAMEDSRLSKSSCDVRVDKIIYLAAACSIRDFSDSVGRYMVRTPQCETYALCLHPKREVGEKFLPYLPLVFSGSLLTWIDEFFQNPTDFQERTLGAFENCILAHQYLPQTSKFHLKAFEENESFFDQRRPESGPQKHGEMGDFRFWEKTFYEPVRRTDSRPPYPLTRDHGKPIELSRQP